nr:MAG TPA: hypothetical protein [Crassvirales sp.]
MLKLYLRVLSTSTFINTSFSISTTYLYISWQTVIYLSKYLILRYLAIKMAWYFID